MNARPRALVVLNPAAHGGTGARRFEAISPAVASRLDATIVLGRADAAWIGEVHSALARGVRVFVSAGGDGTAHALLNALIDAPGRPPLASLTLGAIGLGSSNDLLKPVRTRIDRVPVRLDLASAAPRDVVRCRYVGETASRTECFLVSASLGVTACANARFSEEAPVARWLRKVSTPLAIACAAARTVAAWRDLPAELQTDGGAPELVELCSLNVLKTEWVSGRFHLGHPIAADSGELDIALVADSDRLSLVADLLALLRGRFDGRPGHRFLRARSLDVRLQKETPLELDGEIERVRAVRFDLYPERICVCG
ncbi:MAG TPA: diacylglycerol kinase family protein [Burkholderiaceae bacterium]|nr:diacylglycerol kinase family protein [Burkholderiaceae bacterium]HQR71045.1 diacylglycerol kinase family protein [Burkholderiaceae bacterium]